MRHAPGTIDDMEMLDGKDRADVAGLRSAPKLLTVTELAQQLGVTARAIRFYEDKGLISPSRAGATRVYTRREHARMQLILRGKRLGFSLREIKQFLDLYDVDPAHAEQRRQLLDRVRHRIEELEKTRQAVSDTLAELRDIEAQTLKALHGGGGGGGGAS